MKYSLLSVALLIASGPLIAANIPAISKEFTNVNPTYVGLLTTIPSFFLILGVLIANRLDHRLGKKKTILIGLGLVFIGGTFPVLKHNIFSLLFLSRCVFGLGIGFFNRLIIQMISDLYENNPQKKANVIGLESAFEGLGGITLTIIVGQLLKINWYTSFLIYALALPIFLAFLFFVPDDKKQTEGKDEQMTILSNSKNEKISYRSIFGYGILLFMVVTIFINYNIQVTPLILEKHIGTATNGSNTMAFIGIGVFIAGFLFGRIFRIVKDYILPTALILFALAIYVATISHSIIITMMCSLAIGFSFRCIMPYFLHTFTQQNKKTAKLGTTMVLIAYNIGATLSPYEGEGIRRLFHFQSVKPLFITNSIILLIISVIALEIVFISRKKNKMNQSNHLT